MNALLILFGGGVATIFVITIATAFIHKSTFKYKCQVAIPVGESADDVIWADDIFKVKKVGNHDEVLFFRHKGKSYSPPYFFWSKWINKKSVVPDPDINKWVKVKGDLRRALIRGAHFYRVSENEYKVIKINKDGDFDILDNDSKELLIDDIERTAHLTKKTSDTLIKGLVWVGSLLIIAALAVAIFVLTTNFAAEQSANIVDLASKAIVEAAEVGA